MQYSFNSVTITMICLVLILAIVFPLCLYATPLSPASTTAASGIDPDKPSSEMNHHIAGIFLIAIGLSVIWSKSDRSRAWLRWLPPILFIGAGLFLATWSDSEIWPRGNLSWYWLLQHDAEARQHKLYALLLIVFGLVEYVQSNPRLRKPWLKMVFPVLCVMGGASLFLHHHSGMVMASANAMDHMGHHVSAAHDMNSNCQGVSETVPANMQDHHHGTAEHGSAEHGAAELSHPCPSAVAQAGSASIAQGHAHALMGAGANIQRQHTWFAVVGFCVALFKFLHDFARPPVRVSHSLWANSVIVLGILLLIYVE
ncbi:MAG TPA: hypothetical protein VGK36_11315 [Candidatus Angelobacter sp.]|jgi:hypothetical protein